MGNDYITKKFHQMIELLEGLTPIQVESLKERWIDQLVWMENSAKKNQRRFYLLRLIIIIGGMLIPAQVSMQISNGIYLTIILSLLIGCCSAIDSLFQYGEKWLYYRRTAEALKSEGWMFLNLSGRYGDFTNHSEAHRTFIENVERLCMEDLEIFSNNISSLTKARAKDENKIG